MRHRSHARAVLLAVIATLTLASPVAAGEFRSGQTLTIDEGETIDDDLYAAGGAVSIDGTVNGDASVSGGSVSVTGTVTGSLNVGGGIVEVSGDVDGAVRVSGGTVRIAGSVGRDLVVFGGTVTIESAGQVAGDVAGGVGTLTVDGSVDGSVIIGVGDLTIGSGAVVGGDVTYTSSREATIADDAQIGGEVEQRPTTPFVGGESVIPDNPVLNYVGLLLGMLLLGWTLIAIRPRLAIGSADTMRTAPLAVVGIGLVSLIGQFILLALLIVLAALLAIIAGALGTGVFGLAVVLLLLIVIAIILSTVPIALAIGNLVLPGDRSPYLAYLVGAAILALVIVAAGFVPALGGIAFLIVWVLGLGAFVVYAFRTRERPYVLEEAPVAAA
jgi:cytoskeletal protein CcmA (bactofilin family)